MNWNLINADVLAGLALLPDKSVHCIVTSPPYWSLRDYKVDGQLGLEPTFALYLDRMTGRSRRDGSTDPGAMIR
jgi:DNA modification methylase